MIASCVPAAGERARRQPKVALKRNEHSLAHALPTLATELEALLCAANEIELAETIPNLLIVDRCRCGDSFCATIYMVPPPQGPWGPGHYTLPLLSPRRSARRVSIVKQPSRWVSMQMRRGLNPSHATTRLAGRMCCTSGGGS